MDLNLNIESWIRERQYSLFEHYLGEKIGVKLYKNPLRVDHNPTCSFFTWKGWLLFHDFATSKKYNVIQFVSAKYCITLYEAKYKIYYAFKNSEIVEPAVGYRNVDITISTTSWNSDTIGYWKALGIDERLLKKNRVKPATTIYIDGRLYARSTKLNPIFSYSSLDGGRHKTYRPLEKDKQKKWRSTMFLTDILGYFPAKGSLLVITSSLKDAMVIQTCGFNSISFNAERIGVSELTDIGKELEMLKKRFKHIAFFMDNDATGIEANAFLSRKYRLPYLRLTTKDKDISDLRKRTSFRHTSKHLRKMISKAFRQDNVPY